MMKKDAFNNGQGKDVILLCPGKWTGCAYQIVLQPVWRLSSNDLVSTAKLLTVIRDRQSTSRNHSY